MPEVKKEKRAINIQYFCDECGEPMSVSIMLLSNPPKYKHTCKNGHIQILNSGYPRIEYQDIEEK